MGFPDEYFLFTTPRVVASHIEYLYAAEIMRSGAIGHKRARSMGLEADQRSQPLRFSHESADFMVAAVTSAPGQKHGSAGMKLEQDLVEQFVYRRSTGSPDDRRWRLRVFRSAASIHHGSDEYLRIFILSRTDVKVSVDPGLSQVVECAMVGTKDFQQSASPERCALYEQIMGECIRDGRPAATVVPVAGTEGTVLRCAIAVPSDAAPEMAWKITHVYHTFNMTARSKRLDHFHNGLSVFAFDAQCRTSINSSIEHMQAELEARVITSMCVPMNSSTACLLKALNNEVLTWDEFVYAVLMGEFAYFCVSHAPERVRRFGNKTKEVLSQRFGDQHLGVVDDLMESIYAEYSRFSFSPSFIMSLCSQNIVAIKACYADWQQRHDPAVVAARGDTSGVHNDLDIAALIGSAHTVSDREETVTLMNLFLDINKSVVKTNFFSPKKSALVLRVPGQFLKDEKCITGPTPFGVFFVQAATFRGFHVRFADVARGGIRVVRSRSRHAYVRNRAGLMNECLNLASTQQLKNKDICEGGSKGAILMTEMGHVVYDALFSFTSYIGGILDLIVPERLASLNIVNHYKDPEIIFIGPDENTATYMDTALNLAKSLGYQYWKAFSTGKALSLGGVPHDLYGMTTRSVREFKRGLYKRLNMNEASLTKVITGGTSGDLGRNEVRLGEEKVLGIVDGTGVLYDPAGLDRIELMRLVDAVIPIDEFSPDKLSKDGFLVKVTDSHIVLPDGNQVANGVVFRDVFHLSKYFAADVFIPCGGRPNAVNGSNVQSMFTVTTNVDGTVTRKPKFKVIVEGANLFFSDDARVELEYAGVHLVKDAAANKGGVTSSSMEVLASLSLSDEEFSANMCQKSGVTPDFYSNYVREIQDRVQYNAALEFNCLWRLTRGAAGDSELTNDQLMCRATGVISRRINELAQRVLSAKLYESEEQLRLKVFKRAFPKTLQALVPLDTLVERVPPAYLRSLFAATWASQYVYENGVEADEVTFFRYMQTMLTQDD